MAEKFTYFRLADPGRWDKIELISAEEKPQQANVIELAHFSYSISSPEVPAFFGAHPAIPKLLALAVPHLRQHFGVSVVCHLQFNDDDIDPTLYVVIQWPGPVDEARRGLKAFDEWWIPESSKAGGYLVFTYELI